MPGYSDPGFDTLALHAGAAPDPATGARDLGVPQALIKNFRHGDMGVYVELLGSGTLRPGDTLHAPT